MTWAIFPDEKDTRAVIELLTTGSERVMAVVGGALLEEAIDRTLRERLLKIPRLVDNLLEVDRPLGNMGPKIDLLRLLGAFDDKAHLAMKGIAGVRNFFAHHLDASLESQAFRSPFKAKAELQRWPALSNPLPRRVCRALSGWKPKKGNGPCPH